MASISGIVAIVGRPNVGKSSLFNLMTRSKKSIVDDQPGVTRDRIYGLCEKWDGKGFTVIDTGGFETDDIKYQPFAENLVWKQTEAAILESDVAVMVLDGKEGFNPHDRELVQYLKKIGKKTIFALNKIDGVEKEIGLWEFLELVEDAEIFPISAAHNRGVSELIETVQTALTEIASKQKKFETAGAIKVALIGRPNAGKSSILNRLVGEDRALVSELAGTTRDSLDVWITYNKKTFVLVDTAGIRRKTKINEKIESASVTRSLRAMDEADVVVLVIDAVQGITDQDARLANLAVDRHKPFLIVVNKWDLVPDKETQTAKTYADNIRNFYLKDMAFVPVLFTSALTNQRVHNILSKVESLHEMANRRIPTAEVNEVMQKIVDSHNPAVVRKFAKRIKFYYATQVRSNPPTIVMMCNIAEAAQESYKRFVTNQFRELLGFQEIPIRVILRDKKSKQGGRAARSEEEMLEMLGAAKEIFSSPTTPNYLNISSKQKKPSTQSKSSLMPFGDFDQDLSDNFDANFEDDFEEEKFDLELDLNDCDDADSAIDAMDLSLLGVNVDVDSEEEFEDDFEADLEDDLEDDLENEIGTKIDAENGKGVWDKSQGVRKNHSSQESRKSSTPNLKLNHFEREED